MPAEAPTVTGISPKEGPPGTRVTIRGQHFGNSPRDLMGLTICGCNCLLSAEWVSPNKIIARSGPANCKGDIIVMTRQGGIGASTVQFRGYMETVGPLKESAVWVEEEISNWGRRAMSTTAMQQQDPLGLSVEDSSKSLPDDQMNQYFPHPSSESLSSEDFVPARFLLKNHHGTSFDDLKAGLSHLQRKVGAHKEGQLSFLKANVGAVMDQLDTLCVLRDKFEQDALQVRMMPTVRLEQSIEDSRREADRLFKEVLNRRENADATRNALSAMQRNKFLFLLPTSIEKNSIKGDYDLIVNDYTRAKSLFSDSDIEIFKRVFEEVDKRIDSLISRLKTQLTTMPCTLEDQKKLARNLASLDGDNNHAWNAIEARYNYLLESLTAPPEKPPENSNNALSPSSKLGGGQNWQGELPIKIQTVEDCLEVFSFQFPELWKLGQSYFSGELQVEASSGHNKSFRDIILRSIKMLCEIVKENLTMPVGTLTPKHKNSNKNSTDFGPWLPQCLTEVVFLYKSLCGLDLPSDALALINNLIQDLRFHCLLVIMKQTSEQVRMLYKQETWVHDLPSATLPGKQSGGLVTALPSLFESKVTDAVTLLKESIFVHIPGETTVNPILANPSVHSQYGSLAQSIFQGFVQTLEHLSSSKEVMSATPMFLSQILTSSLPPTRQSGNRKLPSENPQLIILSNCLYTRDIVLPSVMKSLASLTGDQETPPLLLARETAVNLLSDLDKQLCEKYLESKTDPLVGTIEPSMYIGEFDWAKLPERSVIERGDLRPYIKEILANLISVNCEVQNVLPSQCRRLLSYIVEMIAEEVSRLMTCIPNFNDEGVLQAHIDLAFLRKTLSPFCTPTAKAFFNEALEAVPPVQKAEHKKAMEHIFIGIEAKMRLQLLCLKP
ncbi:Hypothetical predicted protein [Cloeon dipterum]|uniref:Exocyst complex component 2 n=2 Tax=Cloeon dipterum TaxID=197152 RepID=A0A8S1BZN8_9INSE|nr:Hypothetical predicted protein [Cloeon dipterum]